MSYSPNTTILLAGCNAKCEFCSTKTYRHPRAFIGNLEESLDRLPEECTQVSISGGEPTINAHFLQVLGLARVRFGKVVLNTNGTGLYEKYKDTIGRYVDHVNISRHHHNSLQNSRAFGFSEESGVLTNYALGETVKALEFQGVDVTLNCFYDTRYMGEGFDFDRFLTVYISLAKSVGAHAICFRYDMRQYSQDPNPIERYYMRKYKAVATSECPVCRSYTFLRSGMRVTLKSSANEPSIDLRDPGHRPYEFIIQPSGKITLDWAGEVPYRSVPARDPFRDYEESLTSCGVGAYTGCGISIPERKFHNSCGSEPYRGCGISTHSERVPHTSCGGYLSSRC